MKTNKNSRAVLVGIFVFLALVIFIAGVLTLGGDKKAFADTIDVKAVFSDVNGLGRGANIWLSGVKVGTVRDIKFNNEGTVDVDLSIDEQYRSHIHKDTRAKMGTDGLIGNKIVVLYGGSASSPLITGGEVLPVEKAVGMDEMMTTLQANNRNILEITTDFKQISKGLLAGEGTIGKLLREDEMANQIQLLMARLTRVSNNAELMTKDLSDFTAKLDRPGSLPQQIVSDTVVFSRLKQSMVTLSEVTREAGEVMASLKATSQALQSDLANNKSAVSVLLRDEEAAASIKTTLKNLETSTQKLDENMEALQSSFFLRGFFRKKEKEEKSKL